LTTSLAGITMPYNYVLRDYQTGLWDFMMSGGKRAVAVWHRRAGKDLLSINMIATQMMLRRGLYWHCFPTYAQGRKVIWNGFRKDGSSFLSAFPEQLVESKDKRDMSVQFKEDSIGPGSIYQVVGTDDIDRLVGSNPIGVVFSEYSLCDPKAWHLIQPILRENGGWAVFIYTPRGHNHGFELFQKARANPKWFCEQRTILDTYHLGQRVVTDEMVQEDRDDGMPEELVQQEYYGAWEAPLVGAYYSEAIVKMRAEGRITRVPYDPTLPVRTAWDLGIGEEDQAVCLFYQKRGYQIQIFDMFEETNKGYPHLAKLLSEREYQYEKHHAPWDIVCKEQGTGKTRRDTMKGLGYKLDPVKKLPKIDGINAVRNLLPACVIDEARCGRLIDALSSYKREWDEDLKTFSDKAVHDWASHPSDALRTMAVGERAKKIADVEEDADGRFVSTRRKKELQADRMADYDPLHD